MVMELTTINIPSTTFSAKPYSLQRENPPSQDEGPGRGKAHTERFDSNTKGTQTPEQGGQWGIKENSSPHTPAGRQGSGSDLCPAARAMGDCPLGGRGSSHVLISTSTLSRYCKDKTWEP